MMSGKEKEILVLLFKDFSTSYNASSISRKVGMSPRGALKALKNLEKQDFVIPKPFGKAIECRFNFGNPLARKSVELFLLEEAELKRKRWVAEFKEFEEARVLILFGSVLRKEKGYNDIDMVVVVDEKNFDKLEKKIKEKNEMLLRPVHPVWQSPSDLRRNLRKPDPVILDALRTGVVLKGGSELVEVVCSVAGS